MRSLQFYFYQSSYYFQFRDFYFWFDYSFELVAYCYYSHSYYDSWLQAHFCKGTQSPTLISGKLPNTNSEHTPSMRSSIHSPIPKTTPKSNSEPISVPTLVHQYLGLGLVNVLRDTSELDLEIHQVCHRYPIRLPCLDIIVVVITHCSIFHCCYLYIAQDLS